MFLISPTIYFQAANFRPLLNRVLVQRLAAETKTKAGIMLPEKSLGKVLQGTVVAVGPGARMENGTIVPTTVSVGDKVLLPEYGGTKVTLDDEVSRSGTLNYVLFMPNSVDYGSAQTVLQLWEILGEPG